MKITKISCTISHTLKGEVSFVKSGVTLEAHIEDTDKSLETVREKLHRLCKLLYIRNVKDELRWMRDLSYKSPEEWVEDQFAIANKVNTPS